MRNYSGYVRILIWLILTVALVFIHRSLHSYAEDDAYIHARIAQNFASYGQPYFNLGDPVQASSSSAWVLLLSLIFRLGVPYSYWLPTISILNALLTAAGAFVFSRLLSRVAGVNTISNSRYWLFVATYISLLILPSIGLMETPLALLVFGIGLEYYSASDFAREFHS